MKILKRITSLSFVLISFISQAQIAGNLPLEGYPVMSFDEINHDFGTLNEGDSVETTYTFTNTGNAPLSIDKIKASCGCTVPGNWKKTPILPGEKSQFTVRFNTRGKIYKQHKTIRIYCNTRKGKEKVSFTANVIPDPALQKLREESVKKRQKALIMKKEKARKLQEKPKKLKKTSQKAKEQPGKRKKRKRKIRKLTKKIAKEETKLKRLKAKFNRKNSKGKLSPKKVLAYQNKIAKRQARLEKHYRKLKKLKRE